MKKRVKNVILPFFITKGMVSNSVILNEEIRPQKTREWILSFEEVRYPAKSMKK